MNIFFNFRLKRPQNTTKCPQNTAKHHKILTKHHKLPLLTSITAVGSFGTETGMDPNYIFWVFPGFSPKGACQKWKWSKSGRLSFILFNILK